MAKQSEFRKKPPKDRPATANRRPREKAGITRKSNEAALAANEAALRRRERRLKKRAEEIRHKESELQKQAQYVELRLREHHFEKEMQTKTVTDVQQRGPESKTQVEIELEQNLGINANFSLDD